MISEWQPKSKIGSQVLAGQYTDLKVILEKNIKIKELEILTHLNESFNLKVVSNRRVSKTIDSGRVTRYSILCFVGNHKNILGLGKAKSTNKLIAVNRAKDNAMKNLIVVKLNHHINKDTVRKQVSYKLGSSTVIVQPVSIGTGIVASGWIKQVCEMAGLKDIRVKLKGSNNRLNYLKALFYALQKL